MRRCDVAVAGGGPAGAVAAILLAREGARVAIASLPDRRPRVEGLSSRTVAVLGRLGLPVEGVGAPAPREVVWGGMPAGGNAEHPVDRARFDAALLDAARAAGVAVIGMRVGRIHAASGALALGDTLEAPVMIEARGRRAPARPGRVRGIPAVALCGRTGAAPCPGRVESRGAGWSWRAPPLGDGAWMQLVCDGDAVRRGGAAAAWASVAPEIAPPRRLVARAAELRLNAPEIEGRVVPIGDAAVAMDPLAGHGIFWALSSAMAAVPMVGALIDREPELARAFHRARVVGTFWRQARIGRDFYRAAGRDGPFWTRRAAWPDDAPAHADGGGPHLARRVVVAGGRLAEAEVLVTPEEPDGVAFVAGVALAPVLARLGTAALPEAGAFARRILPEAPPRAAAAVHAWLAARGIGGGIAGQSTDRQEVAT